jgi:hypothetical protein
MSTCLFARQTIYLIPHLLKHIIILIFFFRSVDECRRVVASRRGMRALSRHWRRLGTTGGGQRFERYFCCCCCCCCCCVLLLLRVAVDVVVVLCCCCYDCCCYVLLLMLLLLFFGLFGCLYV